MARLDGAELSVGLLPLLAQRVEIGEARLSGLTLNLARDQRGRNNWQDLAGGAAPAGDAPAAAPSDGAPAALDLGVGAIEIADAHIVWNDASTGSRWELTDFGLRAEDFGPGRRFPLEIQFSLAGAEVAVAVAASMQATLVIAADEYKLEELVSRSTAAVRAAWRPEPSGARCRSANLEAETPCSAASRSTSA
jgi:AsmA protein